MKHFWEDKKDLADDWSHLHVEISQASDPGIYAQTGGNHRLKLLLDGHPFLWACIAADYWDCEVLVDLDGFFTSQVVIPPITARNLRLAATGPHQDPAFWARFFFQKLAESPFHFLHAGMWHLYALREKYPSQVLLTSASYTIALGFGEPAILPLKSKPDVQSARVKWWRKKVREGTCPPLFVWFHSGVQAYLLVDGHSRLEAHLLEGKRPQVIAIASVKEVTYPKDPKVQAHIQTAIEERNKHRYKRPLSTAETNQLLLQTYDNRPHALRINRAVAKREFEEQWVQEVRDFGKKWSLDSAVIEGIIERA